MDGVEFKKSETTPDRVVIEGWSMGFVEITRDDRDDKHDLWVDFGYENPIHMSRDRGDVEKLIAGLRLALRRL